MGLALNSRQIANARQFLKVNILEYVYFSWQNVVEKVNAKKIDLTPISFEGSSFIHGNWYEMSIFNLTQRGRCYLPDLDFSDSDPRIALPVTIASLHSANDFLKGNKSDPEKYVRSIIQNLAGKTKVLYDQYCEGKYADV